jgi:glycosyltransferase involved in cell wall biosynthesis
MLLRTRRSSSPGNRPRILHIEGGSKFGGDSVLVLELARAAVEHGYDVDVLATDPVFKEMVLAEGLGLVDMDVIRREIRPLWDLRGAAKLTAFLRRSDYSIVHTHTSKAGLVGRLAATLAGVPGIIHTVHLFPFHEETGRAATAAYVAAERLAAHWCDRIVTVSGYLRESAVKRGIGKPEQVVSIPNGLPPSRTRVTRERAAVRAELGVDDAFVLLSTGRLADQKGLEYLIRAAALFRGNLPSARVLLAGDGPLREQLEALVAELGLGDVVTLLGFRTDVADLLEAADLVVFPSLWEGLSISLLEAMAAGKPVVTTTIASNLEATAGGREAGGGETALLVPPKDPDALAAAITALAHDPARLAAIGAAGRRAQQERYTMQRMLDAYLAEYDHLLRTPVTGGLRTPHPVEG